VSDLLTWCAMLRVARIQESRLRVIMQLLKQREEQHFDMNNKRLDRLWFVVLMNSRKLAAIFAATWEVVFLPQFIHWFVCQHD